MHEYIHAFFELIYIEKDRHNILTKTSNAIHNDYS